MQPGRTQSDPLAGHNPWRRRLSIRLSQPAQDGRANHELIDLLATLFHHPSNRIHITTGATNRHKRLRLVGLGHTEAADRLQSAWTDRTA